MSRNRPSVKLEPSLEKRLLSYSLAAGAALFAAAPAEAAVIVYSPTNLPPTGNNPTTLPLTLLDNTSTSLDVDQNGVVDFFLDLNSGTGAGYTFAGLGVRGDDTNNGILADGDLAAVRFASGSTYLTTDPSGFLAGGQNALLAYVYQSGTSPALGAGQFAPTTPGTVSGYIGFRFLRFGNVHFGWANLTVTTGQDPASVSATLNSFGWETNADTAVHLGPVELPEPGSLSLLAMGAAGLLAWRRKRAA